MHSLARDARRRAQDDVGALMKNLNPDEYDLARRFVFMRDALENVTRGKEHRPGFDAKSVADEVNRLTAEVEKNPDVLQAVDSYKRLMNGVADLLINEGLMSEKNVREWYYPHMLIDFVDQQPKKAGLFGVRTPRLTSQGGLRWRQPGALKERKGSARDINTNLIDTMEKYLTDVYTQVDKRRSLQEIGKNFDIRNNPKEGFTLGEQNQIPEGYVEWDPNLGYSRLRAGSVAERYLGEMIDFGGLDELAKHYGLNKHDFKVALSEIGINDPETLAKKLGASTGAENPGGKYIIPKELARTMDNAIDQMNKAELRGIREQGVRVWKTIVLNAAPVRYNFRNFVGDVQRMYVQFGNEAFDPKVWKYVAQSVHDFYRHGRINDLIQEMLDGGITSSTRIQSEYALSNVNPHLKHLEHGLDTSDLKKAASTIWRFLKYIPEASAAREDVMRGVLVEMNRRRLVTNKPLLTGVADRELVRGLIDVGEARRATRYIARESLLDYGNFTQRENKWRNGWLPFYAWAKGNFQFWSTIGKRLTTEGMKGDTGDQLARGSAAAAVKGAAVTATVLGSIRAWNELVMGDYEESLPENIRKTSHFIVPDFAHWDKTGEWKPQMGADGKILVWQTADALDDFLTFLGIDKVVPEAMSMVRGTLPKEEFLKRQVEYGGWGPGIPGKGPARSILNQIGPVEQLLVQGVLGKRLFPDPFHPADIPLEQRASSVRDIFGLSALPGIEGVVGAAHPGGDVFQPTTKVYDIAKQLGFKTVQEPSILLEGNFANPKRPENLTPYEADLIKRIQQKQYEMRDLEGRMKREISEQSNRQIDAETREVNFQQRMLVYDQLVDELKDLADRLKTLQRTRNYQGRQ